MSAGPQAVPGRTQDQAVLGELLHSLSQPLTTLRCSLEISAVDIAGQRHESVSAALEQADRAIAVVRLMREYLDTEPAGGGQGPVALGPMLRSVVAQLAQAGRERQVQLQLTGGSSGTIALAEPRLRLALQYLVSVLMEREPRGGEVRLRLEQAAWESELRGHGTGGRAAADAATAVIHGVQLAIARRLLESAGASLQMPDGGESGEFLLRVPRPLASAGGQLP